MIWEELQAAGWVDFGVADEAISDVFAKVASGVPAGSEADLAATDLIYLTAAELAVPRGLGEGPDAPFFIEVPESAARLAAFSADCGPFKTHNPREAPKLWDVTLFGSDASKLAWVAATDSVEVLRERFVATVVELAGMYQQLDRRAGDLSETYGPLWGPAPFAARASVWRAKVGVLLGESDVLERLIEVHEATAGGAIA